jgi:hypothetical protein
VSAQCLSRSLALSGSARRHHRSFGSLSASRGSVSLRLLGNLAVTLCATRLELAQRSGRRRLALAQLCDLAFGLLLVALQLGSKICRAVLVPGGALSKSRKRQGLGSVCVLKLLLSVLEASLAHPAAACCEVQRAFPSARVRRCVNLAQLIQVASYEGEPQCKTSAWEGPSRP